MSFNSELIDLLKTNPHFVDDEGELLLAAVQDHAWKIDHDLVKLLLSKKEIKAKFFDEIEGHWIFNINTFLEYISQKNFLDNSYTRFRNRIGLTIGEKYLRERGEVALAWAYKDTVLEGGQTKEEEKRKEIFFNEVLAQDEINRLLDPKVLTNFTRYTAKGKQPVKDFKRDENGVIRENLILKGNNLLALYTLKTQFRGQVKLIYIDPPYNTGSDGFGYNDSFNHSSWLTFMKNRLEVAKDLLTSDGIIFVQCDYHEDAYLRILLDEIFGREKFIQSITVKMSDASGPKMAHAKTNIPKLKDTLLVYCKGDFKLIKIPSVAKSKWDGEYSKILSGLSENNSNELLNILATDKPTEDDLIKANRILKTAKLMTLSEFDGSKKQDTDWMIENSWRIVADKQNTSLDSALSKIRNHPKQDVAAFRTSRGKITLYRTDKNFGEDTRVEIVFAKNNLNLNPCDIWLDISTAGGFSEEGGVSFPKGKKPETLLRRIIEMATSPQDIVLDYHLGSGSTAATAHKLGRQYIGIEQLDYENNDSVIRLQNVVSGDATGISKNVNWQGGGEFINCELMKYNEAFMERIQAAKNSKELLKIWREMAEGSFLNWYVNPEIPDEAIKDFEAIGDLEKQKKLLAELLDKNQLYVNLSEIDDAQFKVSKEDKALNKAFYGEA